MAKEGSEAKVVYLDADDSKKSASEKIETIDNYIKVDLAPSKIRKNFNTILVPWARVIKVIMY